MKQMTKDILRKTHLESSARELIYGLMRARRHLAGIDRWIVSNYFEREHIRKLHIGCGGVVLGGWLNSDLMPKISGVMHLDATKVFPFESNQFTYVFSQHMIEHISHPHGQHMLNECHRVLMPGGKIRISTPDIRFLIDLYRSQKSDVQQRYIEWSSNRHIKGAPYYDAVFVVNNYFKDWGHSFIYDEEALRKSFQAAGFTQVVKRELDESDEEVFRKIECQDIQDEFLRLETITLEGTKP
jgi:predicted SAM-dependent methyltransferase